LVVRVGFALEMRLVSLLGNRNSECAARRFFQDLSVHLRAGRLTSPDIHATDSWRELDFDSQRAHIRASDSFKRER